MWPKTLASQGEAGIWGFLLIVCLLCQGWGLWQGCFSAFPTHFDVAIFSVTWSVVDTQLVSGFFSEEIALFVAIQLVCAWEEGNSQAFCVLVWTSVLWHPCPRVLVLLCIYHFGENLSECYTLILLHCMSYFNLVVRIFIYSLPVIGHFSRWCLQHTILRDR